jgi:hypothetical protein
MRYTSTDAITSQPCHRRSLPGDRQEVGEPRPAEGLIQAVQLGRAPAQQQCFQQSVALGAVRIEVGQVGQQPPAGAAPHGFAHPQKGVAEADTGSPDHGHEVTASDLEHSGPAHRPRVTPVVEGAGVVRNRRWIDQAHGLNPVTRPKRSEGLLDAHQQTAVCRRLVTVPGDERAHLEREVRRRRPVIEEPHGAGRAVTQDRGAQGNALDANQQRGVGDPGREVVGRHVVTPHGDPRRPEQERGRRDRGDGATAALPAQEGPDGQGHGRGRQPWPDRRAGPAPPHGDARRQGRGQQRDLLPSHVGGSSGALDP